MSEDKPITWITTKAPAFAFLRPDGTQHIYTCKLPPVDADLYAAMKARAEAAEARVKELENRIVGMLPAAQPLVTSIELLPLAMANPLADMTKRAEAAEALVEALRRHVPVVDWAEAVQQAQWKVAAKHAIEDYADAWDKLADL